MCELYAKDMLNLKMNQPQNVRYLFDFNMKMQLSNSIFIEILDKNDHKPIFSVEKWFHSDFLIELIAFQSMF